jgi:hypothetical protein
MKAFALIVWLLQFVPEACGQSLTSPVIKKYATHVIFLKIAPGTFSGRFLFRNGQAYSEDAEGKFTLPIPMDSAATQSIDETDGSFILGAPAVVTKLGQIEVSSLLSNGQGVVRVADTSKGIRLVREDRERTSVNDEMTTRFTVFASKPSGFSPLGRFSILDNVYNQYLDEIWPIDDRLLVIVTRSSRHPGLNSLFLYDLNDNAIAGKRQFSVLQYLPEQKAFWLIRSIANCANFDDVLADARVHSMTEPVYRGGTISDVFSNIGDIKLEPVGATAEVTPKPQGKAQQSALSNSPEAKPSFSREHGSPSISWAVVAVLIGAAICVLCLVTNRRK